MQFVLYIKIPFNLSNFTSLSPPIRRRDNWTSLIAIFQSYKLSRQQILFIIKRAHSSLLALHIYFHQAQAPFTSVNVYTLITDRIVTRTINLGIVRFLARIPIFRTRGAVFKSVTSPFPETILLSWFETFFTADETSWSRENTFFFPLDVGVASLSVPWHHTAFVLGMEGSTEPQPQIS
ncbi:unnamed protein product [Allacma fusca]|uniref:Uncharacterized protein n=1 Tax=Allacma fusca TaxID=39272 RepID=A0A8J2JYS7_9HEXA|nr:unnamed protein product [Allacma fusca]